MLYFIAIRSGDYHMFQDVNYEVDLDMFRERGDGDDVDESDRRMRKKMRLSQVGYCYYYINLEDLMQG